MPNLVKESLQYVRDHVQEIIKLPIDLDCINKALIKELATLFSYEDLDKIRDRKDKIVGSLFLHKIQDLLKTKDASGEEVNVLFRCQPCGRLFTEAQKPWSVCQKSPPFITFHGESISEHVADYHWDVSLYLASLRQKRLSWKDIFWRLWAVINSDVCKVCQRHFTIAEIAHCSYHLSLPTFDAGNAIGTFPCCNTEVQRFEGGTVRPSGCCTRHHVMNDQSRKEAILAIVAKHPDILIPWGDGHSEHQKNGQATENPPMANSLYAPAQDTSDVETDTSSSSSDDTFGPDWRKQSKWCAGTHHPVAFGDGDVLRKSLQGTVTHRQHAQPSPSQPPRGSKPVPKKRRRKSGSRQTTRGGGDPGSSSGPSGEWWHRLGPKAKTAYFIDVQREDDARRMVALIASLEKKRSDYDKGTKVDVTRCHAPKKPPSRRGQSSLSCRSGSIGK